MIRLGKNKVKGFTDVDLCDEKWGYSPWDDVKDDIFYSLLSMLKKGENICIHSGDYPLQEEIDAIYNKIGNLNGIYENGTILVNYVTERFVIGLDDEASLKAYGLYFETKGMNDNRQSIDNLHVINPFPCMDEEIKQAMEREKDCNKLRFKQRLDAGNLEHCIDLVKWMQIDADCVIEEYHNSIREDASQENQSFLFQLTTLAVAKDIEMRLKSSRKRLE